MKRVYCLYSVSTEHQVEKEDIPMQRNACREFASEKGWVLEKEYYEKGISGYKVSAEERDAIQKIKCAAVRREFDILLVFMFDRLGRRDDETPFVVEWFVRNGIAVWSVKEGEQRFDNHIDKLLNYIQFWQASGESIKTSIRTKTRMEQLTREGYFTGGSVPYGYRLAHLGRVNRQNREVYDLAIDTATADVIRLIYHKYVYEGMGTYRLAQYLTASSIPSKSEDHWHTHTVSYILQNPIYTGFLRKGAACSDSIPSLQIISDDLFERAQQQRLAYAERTEYARQYYQKTDTPLLLLGLAYCGHCGKRLIRGSSGRMHKHKDDTVTYTLRYRYICSVRLCHKERCAGPSGYSIKLLEETVLSQMLCLLQNMQFLAFLEHFQVRVSERVSNLTHQKESYVQKIGQIEKSLDDLNYEIVKALGGESELSMAILQGAIESMNTRLRSEKERLQTAEESISTLCQRAQLFQDIASRAGSLSALLASEDPAVMADVLRLLVRKNEVFHTGSIKIEYAFSFADGCESLDEKCRPF